MSRKIPLVTRSMLAGDLRELGVGPGQTVMLHVSVKAIGWVVGGPDVVIQALLDVLTPEGTLMMYVSWEDSPYELAEWPEERRRAYLEECPPFDRGRSRAYREWSILTEYLRTWPGAFRSDHPDASFAAVGRLAEWLTAEHPLQYGYGPGSPLAKLVEAKGRVLLLGSPLHDITLLHYSEHVANVPKPVIRYRMPVLREGERVWVEIEEFDTDRLIGGRSGGNYFRTIPRECLASGSGREGKVGAARSYVFDAAPLNAFAVEWLERAFGEAERAAAGTGSTARSRAAGSEGKAVSELPECVIRTYEDDEDELPREAEELFEESLADSREELPARRPDRDQWRLLLTCAVTGDGHVLGGVHLDIGPVNFGPLSDDRVAILEALFVRPEYRRKGLGTRLVEKALEAAREAGCRHVRCNVRWDCPAEIALYKKCGFALPCFEDGEYFVVKPLRG